MNVEILGNWQLVARHDETGRFRMEVENWLQGLSSIRV